MDTNKRVFHSMQLQPAGRRQDMGRNKNRERLSKSEKKAPKNGLIGKRQGAVDSFSENGSALAGVGMYCGRGTLDTVSRRTVLDMRRPSKSNASILHAILFCVLVVIIVSWALGY